MILAALGPRARALVQAGRSALRPTPSDRERVDAALRARLGPAALPPPGSVAPPPPVTGVVGWKVVAATVLGAGLIGGAVYLARPGPPPSVSESGPPASAASVSASPPPVVREAPRAAPKPAAPRDVAPPPSTAPPVAAPTGARPVAPKAQAPQKHDPLAAEVALLSRATSALRAGRPADALRALEAHQSRFPRGALSAERRAAKAEALCALGRLSAGRAELGHLAPQSPAAARARQACDAQRTRAR